MPYSRRTFLETTLIAGTTLTAELRASTRVPHPSRVFSREGGDFDFWKPADGSGHSSVDLSQRVRTNIFLSSQDQMCSVLPFDSPLHPKPHPVQINSHEQLLALPEQNGR